MQEIAVIGSPEFVLGFRLVGVRATREATEPRQLAEAATAMLGRSDIGILVMDQEDYGRLPEDLRTQLRGSIRPTLVAIGLTEDSALREQIKQAVGVDLWKDN
ncbi:MAG: V-type ATP synthase subunit F [Euryarchaeota archaeon]|nr:V-type ATP synthase subunit F [Euryarchaeota archaeon]